MIIRMFFKISLAVLLVLAPLSISVAVERAERDVLELVVRPNKKTGEPVSHLFKNQVLNLVLQKTKPKYGDFKITAYEKPISQSGVLALMNKGRIFRVTATMSSAKREKLARPVRIPIYKGLLGHRIFIIRPEDQYKFSSVNGLDDLRKLTAIQGHDWPDADILEASGMSVYRSPSYKGIFQMVKAKRGDYFPRGVHEPWAELEKNGNLKLAVETSLLIRYPAPFYFFVRHGDDELYNRIREGLMLAIEDGSFDKLFYSHKEMKDIFEKADLGNRKVIEIDNPGLHPDTPLAQSSLWYKIGDENSYSSH